MSRPRPTPRRATPGLGPPDSRTLVTMPPSRDDDLEWLYGRDRAQQPGSYTPEPTKVMPPPPRGAPPSGDAPQAAVRPPASRGPGGYPAPPGYGNNPRGAPYVGSVPGGGPQARALQV